MKHFSAGCPGADISQKTLKVSVSISADRKKLEGRRVTDRTTHSVGEGHHSPLRCNDARPVE